MSHNSQKDALGSLGLEPAVVDGITRLAEAVARDSSDAAMFSTTHEIATIQTIINTLNDINNPQGKALVDAFVARTLMEHAKQQDQEKEKP